MSKPPAEKLPLALRKNIRDNWEADKPDLEKRLSDCMGESWTLEFNPLELFPYATDSKGKENLGDVFTETVEGAIRYLDTDFQKVHGDAGFEELNKICYAHVITMGFRDPPPDHFIYKACDVVDGKLRVIFKPGELAGDTYGPLRQRHLEWALQYAKPADGLPMSYIARTYIRLEWDAQIKDIKSKVQKLLQRKDMTFDPNWEHNFAMLTKQANKRGADLGRFRGFEGSWEREFPEVMRKYYEGLRFNLEKLKFGEDDMLREGFNEAVESGKVVFRIVDEIEDNDEGYGATIEDGVLYMQCIPEKWDGMPGDTSKNILDLL